MHDTIVLEREGALRVEIRRSRRARRMALRLHPAMTGVELVLPWRTPVSAGLAFLETRRDWILSQAAKLPPRIPFVPGALVPVLGTPHLVVATGRARGQPTFRIGFGTIEAAGDIEHLERRIRDGLTRFVLGLLRSRTHELASAIGRKPGRISVGRASSRWGSCAASGDIRYSWRLVFAPERVLDYVVAHEVAHLQEMNHSERFWHVVERLHPDHAVSRRWLKENGANLLRIG